MCVNRSNRRQRGLTLLEVLIAISIFALIGVASFRVLTSIIDSQRQGDIHSTQLAQFQKALRVVDQDLAQFVDRDIRNGPDNRLGSLLVKSGDYPLELTRGGWKNPLLLSRSSLQRVAYAIGPHPRADEPSSPFFGDDRQYLLRIYWTQLDRLETSQPKVQALLPDVEDFQVVVFSDKGRHRQWPLEPSANNTVPVAPKALEFSFQTTALGKVSRVYNIESYRL